ncbi:apolipoprotein N-acyltransferase, partial [bacterium]|nr:apolipoprotein N-acyltransferase [bacterium]
TMPWIRYPAPFAIVLVESSVVGLMAVAYVFVRARRPRVPAVLLAPSLWCVAEWLRGWGELGFPWGVLGYSQVPFLPALQVASVAGLTGLTFWIVAVNSLVASSLAARSRRLRVALAAAALVALPIAWGAWRLSRPYDPETVRVALVQPNVSNHDKWRPDNRGNIFASMAELTREGAEAGAELVLWPETAAPCYLLKDEDWRPFVEGLARGTGVAIFSGLPDYRVSLVDGQKTIRYTNTAAYWGADGKLLGRMDKIQLVPFGEHVPYSTRFPILDRIDFGEADFVAGERPVLFRLGEVRFANLVCFEAIFPQLTRRYENLGADLLVNITNDSWFGAGAGAIAHRNMAVVRCVETGCGMARCANSGISTGIDPFGRTFGETGLFERTVSVVDVPRRQGRTPFARFGDWVGLLSRLIAAAAVLSAVASRGKMR